MLLEGEEEYSEGTATSSQARLLQLLIESHGIEPQNKGKDPQYHGFPNPGKKYCAYNLPDHPAGKRADQLLSLHVQPRDGPGAPPGPRAAGIEKGNAQKGMTRFTLLARSSPSAATPQGTAGRGEE